MARNAVPGAILARVASSHIRVGTFQFFAARGDVDAVRILADHVIGRHYPAMRRCREQISARYLTRSSTRQAELVAQWMLVGFIHGVMNTDNMSIAGETIDYGPCAFLDAYHPARSIVPSTQGPLCFRQPAAHRPWNLARLAETLLPLLADDGDAAIREAQAAIDMFFAHFESTYATGLRHKLGLFQPHTGDLKLAQELLDCMGRNNADFTLAFRGLCDATVSSEGDVPLRSLFKDPSALDDWMERWRHRLAEEEGMRTHAGCRCGRPTRYSFRATISSRKRSWLR